MSSGWSTYYVLGLSALLTLTTLGVLGWIAGLTSRSRTRSRLSKKSVYLSANNENQWMGVGQKVNTRFFLATHISLVLVTLALILIPCIGAFAWVTQDEASLNRPAFLIISISVLTLVALIYAGKKGDLNWLKSYRQDSIMKGRE